MPNDAYSELSQAERTADTLRSMLDALAQELPHDTDRVTSVTIRLHSSGGIYASATVKRSFCFNPRYYGKETL